MATVPAAVGEAGDYRVCGEMTPYWWLTKDGDRTCRALYERHYSCYRYRDGRRPRKFVGPGDYVALRTADGKAMFVWRVFRDDCIDERTGKPQAGVNCAIFRNEGSCGGKVQSSELIRQADAIANCVWPGLRHYTYVNPAGVRSCNPGFCFIAAGWRRCGKTKGGLLILEKRQRPSRQREPSIREVGLSELGIRAVKEPMT